MLAQAQQTEDGPSTRELLAELASLKTMVAELAVTQTTPPPADLPPPLLAAYQHLVEQSMSSRLAERLTRAVRSKLATDELYDSTAVCRELKRAMAGTVRTAPALDLRDGAGPTVVALVGPSGVGKTTTAAKLATRFAVQEGRRVALITDDAARVAGTERLQGYARILDVPVRVARTGEELWSAVSALSDHDLVLIDTAGRNPRNRAELSDLSRFLGSVRPHRLFLVLSSTAHEATLVDAVRAFGTVGEVDVVVTHLDESVGFGVLVTALARAQARLAFAAEGSCPTGMPSDVREADGDLMADMFGLNDGGLGQSVVPEHMNERLVPDRGRALSAV